MRNKKRFDESKKDNAPALSNGAGPDFEDTTAKPAEEVNEETIEKVNEATPPELTKPPEEGTEAPTPEIEPPVGDGGSNNVDTPLTGTEIVLSGGDPDVLDVTIEEPGYPVHEWQDRPELPLIVPNDAMTDEHLVAFVHQRQGAINNRLRRTIQDYWLIGKAHHFLFLRHGDDKIGPDGKKIKSRWREDWLPRLGYNHTTDQQLRVLASELTFEEVGQYPNKNQALQALGFSVGGVKKAIEHEKKERAQEGKVLGMAEPLEEGEPGDGQQVQINTPTVAKTKPPTPVTPPKVLKKTQATPQAQVEVVDPAAEAEALVVTFGGAEIPELEAAAVGSGFTPIFRSEKRIVGLLWFADDYEPATQKIAEALAKLREVKLGKIQVEPRYLLPTGVIPV